MSLTRTTGSGLLKRGEYDNGSFPFATADWTVPTGWQELGIFSGKMSIQSTGNHAPGFMTWDMAAQSEMLVYTRIAVNNAMHIGAGVLISNIVAGTIDGVEASCANQYSGGRFLTSWDAGTANGIDATLSGINISSPFRVTAWSDDVAAAMYDHNNAATESGAAQEVKTGEPGIFVDFFNTGSQFDVEKFIAVAGRYVLVTGLSGGMKAKIRNSSGVVVAEATESAGTATIDCLTLGDNWFDIHDLRVTTSLDELLEEAVADVWGGESWAYVASVGGPDTPTITAETLGAYSAKTTGSVYSHPDDTPIKAINWQAATDAAFTLDLIDTEYEYDDPDDAPDPPVEFWDLPIDGTEWFFRVRYKAINDVYSAFSAADSTTLDAEDPLTTPSIPTANPTPTTVALTGSALADPEDPDRVHTASQWQIDESGGDYSTPVADSLTDLVNLTSIILGGLTAGTNYIAHVRYRVDDGTWSSYSVDKTFSTPSTPANRPAEPVIADPASEITSTSFKAVASAYSDPTGSPHKQTQWFVLVEDASNVGFPNFASGWGSFYTNTTPVTERTFSGLQQGKTYGVAVRYQAFDGDWSDWSDFVEVDLPADPLGGKALRILSPHHGKKSSTFFNIAFSPVVVDTLYEADYALAEPLSDWTNIFTDEVASGQLWDVNDIVSGFYLIRLRAYTEDAETPYEYRLVYIDQEGEAYDNDVGTPAWEDSFNETDITWTALVETSDWRLGGGDGIGDDAGLIAAKLRTDIGPFRSFDMATSFVIGSSGGPFPWSRFPEQVWRGMCWGLKDGTIEGVVPYAGIFPLIYSVPINALGDGALTRGTGPLFLTVQGWDEYSPGVGGHQFMSEEVEIGTHHFIDNFNIAGVIINKYPEYGGRMRVTTISVNEEDAERTIRLQIVIYGRGIEPPTSGWHIDMAVTTNIFCAYCGDAGKTITQTQNPYGDFFGMTVVPIVACSEDAPIEGGDSEEEEEDVGSISSTGDGKVWAVDLPRFHKTGVGYWHRRSRDSSRPAVVDVRFSTYVGTGNQIYRFDHTDTVSGYWTSPTLNRKGSINEYTLARVILRYESESSDTPVIEATKDGGATWVSGFKATVTATSTAGTATKRMVQAFNVTGPDVRFRITFPEDTKLLVHAARAEVIERGTQQSE